MFKVSTTVLPLFVLAESGPQDRDLSFKEMCEENGFLYEEHPITTSDGYIMTVLRIPGQTTDAAGAQSKPPVFFQHGITSSADTWITNYAEKAPAFVAAAAGYDVWLGNTRGNKYSLEHVTLDAKKDSSKYWDFDWQEMGLIDLPTVLDMITDQTGFEKVAYVGHSQGTTQMFSALTRINDYMASKISLFVALGPVTKIPNQSITPVTYATEHYDLVDDAAWTFGVHSIGSDSSWLSQESTKLFCKAVPGFCWNWSDGWTNLDPTTDDKDRVKVAGGHGGNQSPIKSVLHYAQNIVEDRFQEYADDYHKWFHHDKRTTDKFDLTTIKNVPIAIFAGKSDTLANTTDAKWIVE